MRTMSEIGRYQFYAVSLVGVFIVYITSVLVIRMCTYENRRKPKKDKSKNKKTQQQQQHQHQVQKQAPVSTPATNGIILPYFGFSSCFLAVTLYLLFF